MPDASARVGIASYGTYLPHYRLERSSIGAALGGRSTVGTRSVASYDEDATSMGVESARRALAMASGVSPAGVYFSTTVPPYLDKTNATAIHAALGLDRSALAVDMVGSVRSGIGAVRAAIDAASVGRATLAVLSDIRTGMPGGTDESEGGDGAAAFLFDSGPAVIAETLGVGSATEEFLDRWRIPGDKASRSWEERFGEHVYLPLAESAVSELAKLSGLTVDDFDRVVVTGTHGRSVGRLAATVGGQNKAVTSLVPVIGNAGAASFGLALASVLDSSEPDQLVLMISVADGVDAMALRTTDAISSWVANSTPRVADEATRGEPVSYQTFLTWRGFLDREPPRRPDPDQPAAPPSRRTEEWKFAFVGSRCDDCGTRHMPPQRVCIHCGAKDRMQPERFADTQGTISTFTVDRLAYSMSPPVVVGVIDFDGGGRFQCELTDVDPDSLHIGDRVRMTFRRLYSADGVHDYFWKARPLEEGEAAGHAGRKRRE